MYLSILYYINDIILMCYLYSRYPAIICPGRKTSCLILIRYTVLFGQPVLSKEFDYICILTIHFLFSTFGIDAHWLLLTATFLGNLMISLALALILTLLFESPFVTLEKLLISKLLTTSQRVKSK